MLETGNAVTPLDLEVFDTYARSLKLGSLKTVNERYPQGSIPTWNDFAPHPRFDAF
jgi:hypothetical protein